ncbi:conserved hypothetical protein [Paraburkholderia piptadeniae]|uniref:Uncharacterized protein n=1 Tax=Paraburkholderia piptadeniae TaxID=1701573 RepID=A0A1N7SVQ9_9BURK|nr:hypothetical protein [Paraburkholderia piptadeniae]SIT51562.1 conserved hypothetical protein [Paraburkholderia piptadeniae]
MSTLQLGIYKGFELYPLVFSRGFKRFDAHSRYAEGYDVAVRIGRAGAGARGSRVFRLQLADSIPDFGVARRAAYQRGRDIIDGKVDGATVADL